MVESWFRNFSDKPKLLVIYGPTACGKTGLTIELAKKYDGEVVIADSRQIYRGMNIGTGKVTPQEMQGISHHMLDIRDISENYGVGGYAPEARRIIAEIHARGKLPILSGGTGLFIDAVVGNFTIPEVKADWEYRDELEKFRLEEGNEALWQKLHEVDPDYASELDPRNFRYVIRGLEIWKATGESKKTLGKKLESAYDFLRITPFDGDREKLYERINIRVKKMFDEGLVEEVNSLIKGHIVPSSSDERMQAKRHEGRSGDPGENTTLNDPHNLSGMDSTSRSSISSELGWNDGLLKKFPGLNAIGYREILPYLAGEASLEKTIELVQQNSRHYAKRQLTWFKRYRDESLQGGEGVS